MNRILGILFHLVTVTFSFIFFSFLSFLFFSLLFLRPVFFLLRHRTGGREYLIIAAHRPTLKRKAPNNNHSNNNKKFNYEYKSASKQTANYPQPPPLPHPIASPPHPKKKKITSMPTEFINRLMRSNLIELQTCC